MLQRVAGEQGLFSCNSKVAILWSRVFQMQVFINIPFSICAASPVLLEGVRQAVFA